MKKEEEIIYKSTLEKLKKLEMENEKLKSENFKISNDFINAKALYKCSLSSLKERDEDIKKLKKDIDKKDNIIAKQDNVITKKKEIITKQENVIVEQKGIIAKQAEDIERIKKYLIDQEIMTQKAVNALFGKASNKTKNLIVKVVKENIDIPIKKDKVKEKSGRKEGKQNFDNWNKNNFESEEVTCELPINERMCPDCNGNLILTKTRKVEKIVPVKACIRKITYSIGIYKCENCGTTIEAKIKNPDCFNNSACTPELAGYLSLLSAGLFLPYKRISDLFDYNETPISRELITRYLNKTGELLSGFVETLRKKMQKSLVLMLDETTWNVLNDKESSVNRIWGMTTGPKENHQAVYFLYSSTRQYENLNAMIDGDYDGVIVSDAYGAYFHHSLHQLCWSHLRKYLFDYLNAVKNKESEDYKQIEILFNKANLIFLKERELSSLTEEELKKRRISELKPLIDDYFVNAELFYDENIKDPKNNAINYGLKHKENYYTLLENPSVPMTNNISEQSMRKIVMKRVSSMFSTSIEGAKAMCTILSLVQSARMNNISPDKYITILLRNLDDLKDERVAVSYLPWSTELKNKISFTKEEIANAKEEVTKNFKTKIIK